MADPDSALPPESVLLRFQVAPLRCPRARYVARAGPRNIQSGSGSPAAYDCLSPRRLPLPLDLTTATARSPTRPAPRLEESSHAACSTPLACASARNPFATGLHRPQTSAVQVAAGPWATPATAAHLPACCANTDTAGAVHHRSGAASATRRNRHTERLEAAAGPLCPRDRHCRAY